jgi:hypothetical protein
MFQDALSASARQESMVTEPKQGKQHRNLQMPCNSQEEKRIGTQGPVVSTVRSKYFGNFLSGKTVMFRFVLITKFMCYAACLKCRGKTSFPAPGNLF